MERGFNNTDSLTMAVFTLEDALSVWTNSVEKTFVARLVIRLCVKTGRRRIICLDELSSVVRLDVLTDNTSCVRLYTGDYNQTYNECLSKFVQTDDASFRRPIPCMANSTEIMEERKQIVYTFL